MSDATPPPDPAQPRPAGGARRRRGGSGRRTGNGRGHKHGNRHAPEEHRRGSGPRRGPLPPSPELIAARALAVPTITYPDLPVTTLRTEIAAAIARHQVVVIAGETGSGKTTQLPKICLELGRGVMGTIGHTQPRRIAARSVADRIAEELGAELGTTVGYQVRFTDKVSPTSLIKVMTDGILLAEIQRDPDLLRYDTIIVDEAHERSLNIDFILGYLRRLLPRRPDLKVIITSATIDTERFAAHFALGPDGLVLAPGVAGEPAPVVEVSGRTFPVEIRYRPLSPDRVAPDEDAPLGRNRGLSLDTEGQDLGLASQPSVSAPVSAPVSAQVSAAAEPREELDQPTGIARAVAELLTEGDGDVLVFCSGEREIRDATDALRESLGAQFTEPGARSTVPGAVEVIPLYARLSAAEQHRVFEPHPYRRVIISTNVAETSLTVPGIRYVVDTGYARISRYSARTKVQRLPIEPISQASANQRSGRCGRVADGIAIRLYSEADYLRRPEFTEPEILRTSLASVILQMAALGLGRMEDFPFVEPPELRAVRDGVALLTELGAIQEGRPSGGGGAPEQGGGARERSGVAPEQPGTAPQQPGTAPDGQEVPRGTSETTSRRGRKYLANEGAGAGAGDVRLTPVGRRLAELPIDPRLGRMLLEADRLGVVEEVMIIVSALSVQDVRERPLEAQQQADESHRRFADANSDFLALVTLWDYLRDQQSVMGSSAFRRLCRREYLHFLRVREWQDVHGQLRQLATAIGIRASRSQHIEGEPEAGVVRRRRVDADEVHQAVLAGLLSHIGSWDERRREYAGARGARFIPFPGSALAKKPPAFVMAAELVETSRLFARTCARIRPEWAEQLAGHLVKRVHSEPYWSSKQGAAMCHEKVLLYGVTLVADRIVPYAKVEPALAREMFIRNALVEDEWTTHHRFVAANKSLRAEAAELAERTRRLDLLADENSLFDFFDERLPDHIATARTFEAWWKDARRETPHLLTYSLDLLIPGHAEVDQSGLPQTWHQTLPGGGELELPLTYQFTPGEDADGVTVHIPLAVLPRVRPDGFDWLVPALLGELATATIRALPKPVRIQLVPAPDTAAAALGHLPEWASVAPAGMHDGAPAPSFHLAFARALREVRDVVVPPEAFRDVPEKLPAHLRMNFRVIGERGAILAESSDLPYLQRRLAAQSQSAVQSAVRRALKAAGQEAAGATAARPAGTTAGAGPAALGPPSAPLVPRGASARPATPVAAAEPTPVTSRTQASDSGLTTNAAVEIADVPSWDALQGREIPREVSTAVAGLEVRGYPALVIEGQGAQRRVALRVLSGAEEADASHAAGVRELLLRDVGLAESRVTSRWTGREALTLAASPYRSTTELVRDVQAAAIARLTGQVDLTAVRTETAYRAVRSDVRDQLEDTVYNVVARVVEVLVAHREVEGQVRRATSLTLLDTLQQVREHAASLVYPGFVAATPPERLRELPRYLKADLVRLEKAQQSPDRDRTLAWEVQQLAGEIAAVDAPSLGPVRRARVAQVRWQLEELRVSLFAQQLGTRETVSAKRIRKALAGV